MAALPNPPNRIRPIQNLLLTCHWCGYKKAAPHSSTFGTMRKEEAMIGKLSEEVLEAMLETIPIEFSIVDKNNEVLAWNKAETRIFKRPEAIIGRNVRNCHPKKSLDKVEAILSEMKAGSRDHARFWIDLPIGDEGQKQKILIEYYALRTATGEYLGCIECSQNISGIQSLSGEKRLLD
jgi:PAS domain S-box-containing protein